MKAICVNLVCISLMCMVSCGQNSNSRLIIGQEYVRAEVKKALEDKNYKPFYDILIRDSKTAIAIAEPILFNIYGEKNILNEKPYESYLIDGYWYITGTLPKDAVGGVFEIIINSKNGEVVKLSHSK